jgi:hypothetical protein
MDLRETRAHDDEDAEEPDQDRHHAPPADPFSQKWSGKGRHNQGSEKGDRHGLIEAQVLHRDEIEGRCCGHQNGTRDLQPQFLGLEKAGHRVGAENHNHQQHLSDEAQPDDFGRGQAHLGDEIFGRGVEAGKQRDRGAHQRNCLQAVADKGQAAGGGLLSSHRSMASRVRTQKVAPCAKVSEARRCHTAFALSLCTQGSHVLAA